MAILTTTDQGLSFTGGSSFIKTGASTLMSFNTSGEVGVGTDNPSRTLHVLGGDGGSGTHIAHFEGRSGVVGMYLRGDGRVGIGTTSPDTGLHLYGTSNVSSGFTIEQVYGGTSKKFGFQPVYNDDRLDIWYNSNATAGITLKDGGNVGIGTTNPIGKLTVSADGGTGLEIQTQDSLARVAMVGYDRADSAYRELYFEGYNFNFNTSGTNTRLSILNNGNVGIGTTSPARTLDLSNSGQITFGDSVSNTISDPSGIYWHSGSNYGIYRTGGSWSAANYQQLKLKFITGIILDPGSGAYGRSHVGVIGGVSIGTSYYTTESNNNLLVEGNVGIGTTNPSQELEVNGTVLANDYRALYNIYLTSPDSWIFRSTGGTERVRVTSAGNVGIGTTSPSAKLQVFGTSAAPSVSGTFQGSIFSIKGSSTVFLDMGTTGASGYYAWMQAHDAGTGVNYKLAINPLGGNVGIGTTSPETTLHVNGSIGAYTSDYAAGSTGSRLLMKTFASTGNTYSLIQAQDVGGTSNNVLALQPYGDNVGIGTTSTSHKLDVSGGIFASNYISINAANTNFNLYNNGTTYLNGDTQVDSDFIVTNGNVGIGGSPASVTHGPHLDIVGNRGTLTVGTGYFEDNGTTNFLNGARPLAFGYSGSEYMRVHSNGNVGIGTTSPSNILHIAASAPRIRLEDTLDTGNYSMIAADNGQLTLSADEGNNQGNSAQIFKVDNSEAMRINASGNVGIGTTNPDEKLDVVGTGTQLGSTGYYYNTRIKDSTNSGVLLGGNATENGVGFIAGINQLAFLTYDSGWGERMRINGGNVCIGTTAPATIGGTAKLTVNVGSGTSTPVTIANGSTDSLYIRRYTSGGSYQLQTTSGASNAGNLSLQSYGGKVGIGTTSPSKTLEVNGTLKTASDITCDGTTIFGGTSSLNINLFAAGSLNLKTNNTTALTINSSQEVGIGTTSPKGKLHVLDGTAGSYTPDSEADTVVIESSVVGGISLIGTGSGSAQKQKLAFGTISDPTGAEVRYDPNNSFMSVGTTAASNFLKLITGNGTEAMRLAADGNVGIGTTSPSYKLDVNGTIGGTQLHIQGGYALGSSSNFLYIDPNTQFSSGIYINNAVKVDGGLLGSYNEDLQLRTGANTRLTLSSSTGNATFAADVDVNGITTSDAFRTDTSNTDYNVISRNNTSGTLWVQAAQSNSIQTILSCRYGSATVAQGTEVLAVRRNSSYFINTKLGVGTTNPRTALEVEGTITHKVYSASSLPSASPAGQRAFISDSAYGLATAIGSVVSGGGSNTIPVYSDGSSWRAG
jgi:hypothetical protein